MKVRATITVLLLSAAAAHAQAPPPNPQPVPGPQATVRCAPVTPPNAEQATRSQPGQTTGQSREPLSDRLAQSDGVMCPPSNIDSQIHKDAPAEGNKMPVIPPPGSPGGDPTVRPK
jgi:hypothetical protein